MQNEPHILFVDDDHDTRELMACMLGCSGFRVSVVGSSLEASKLAATECFDAMVIDNWMPELNGVELCKRIKMYDQEIPVIFCSGGCHPTRCLGRGQGWRSGVFGKADRH